MNDTKIRLMPKDSLHLAKGHDDQKSEVALQSDALQGAGSIKSTVNDMVEYISHNIEEKDAGVKTSHQPILKISDNYASGLNWQIHKEKEINTIWEEGNIPGYNSYCVFCPELHIGIVVLTNESDMNSSQKLSKMINKILLYLNPKMPVVF